MNGNPVNCFRNGRNYNSLRVRTLAVIRIYDEPSDLTFVFDDLVRFHGTKSICGLTVSFKVMEAAWQELWTGAPPRREELSVASGFPGPGTRDGFEMVTRAVSRDAFRIIPDAKPTPLVSEAAKGAYFFQLSDNRQIIELGLKPGMLPDDFIRRRGAMARGEASFSDVTDFRKIQFGFSERLLSLAPQDAVNVIDVRPVSS